MPSHIFHYAFNVKNIEETIEFYVKTMNCQQGRKTETWVDFDFFGNEISAHLYSSDDKSAPSRQQGRVDDLSVPIPHFGAVLPESLFTDLYQRLKKAEVEFLLEPLLRYEGQTGEQQTMFFFDPSGNVIEIKSFTDPEEVFSPQGK